MKQNFTLDFSSHIGDCEEFGAVTPCSSLEVPQRLGGIYRLHLQGGRVNQGKTNEQESGGKKSPNYTALQRRRSHSSHF
jgi:hypothetical protein